MPEQSFSNVSDVYPPFLKEDNIFQRDDLNLKVIKKCNEAPV